MDWDSVLEGTGRPGWLGMLMLLLCQKRSTSSLILTSQVRKSNFPRRRGGRLLFCLFGGPCFFLWEITESLKGWRRKPGKSPGIHDIFLPIMANRCLSWLPRVGWFAILRNPLWKGIWTYSEDLPIDFISKASKQLANPPISPPFHVAADLSLARAEERDFATPLAGTHLSLHSLRLAQFRQFQQKPRGETRR